jgi:hypothetical protein
MKNTIHTIAATFIALFLSACASSVMRAGPDTYYVSYGPLPVWMSAAKAKAECYEMASEWCEKLGLVMVPVSLDSQDAIAFRSAGSAELTFRALKPGDPEIQRGKIDKPDSIQRIQIR